MLDHRYNSQLLGIGEVLLCGTLHLKVVTVHQIDDVRVLDVPLQHVVACIGAGGVHLFRHGEVIQTVVRQNVHQRGLLRTHLRARFLFTIDLERGIELLYRIIGCRDDVTGTLGGQHYLIRLLRCGVLLGVVEHGIRHGSIAVTRQALLVHGVEVRLEQLRLYHVLSARQTGGKNPLLDIFQIIRGVVTAQVDMHAYAQLFVCQRFRWIPVELQPGHIVIAVVRLLVLFDGVAIPGRIVRHHRTLTAADVRHLHYTATRGRHDIGCTAGVFVLLIRIGVTRLDKADSRMLLRHIAFHTVKHIRVPHTVTGADEVTVPRLALRVQRNLEVDLVRTRGIRRVVLVLLQEVIGMHRHRCQYQQDQHLQK